MNGHLIYKFCYNEIFRKSANQLVLCLGPTELSLWDTRSTKEHIILIDLEGDPGNLSQALCDTHAALVHVHKLYSIIFINVLINRNAKLIIHHY